MIDELIQTLDCSGSACFAGSCTSSSRLAVTIRRSSDSPGLPAGLPQFRSGVRRDVGANCAGQELGGYRAISSGCAVSSSGAGSARRGPSHRSIASGWRIGRDHAIRRGATPDTDSTLIETVAGLRAAGGVHHPHLARSARSPARPWKTPPRRRPSVSTGSIRRSPPDRLRIGADEVVYEPNGNLPLSSIRRRPGHSPTPSDSRWSC